MTHLGLGTGWPAVNGNRSQPRGQAHASVVIVTWERTDPDAIRVSSAFTSSGHSSPHPTGLSHSQQATVTLSSASSLTSYRISQDRNRRRHGASSDQSLVVQQCQHRVTCSQCVRHGYENIPSLPEGNTPARSTADVRTGHSACLRDETVWRLARSTSAIRCCIQDATRHCAAIPAIPASRDQAETEYE